MLMEKRYGIPEDIEARSFAIIREELGTALPNDAGQAALLVRVIHTTADFSFARNMHLSEGAIVAGVRALRDGAVIITDTRMAEAGIDKKRLASFGGSVHCFMADDDVAETALRNKTTRAHAAIDKAADFSRGEKRPLIFAIGNAPTALFRLCELFGSGELSPALVIGAPVGFVNVVEAKEALITAAHSPAPSAPPVPPIPVIVFRGRKGGSAVAAAVCNALLRLAEKTDGP
jgi:precorrin-8X/cobalt-precorrin-8 methylmutase